MVAYAIVKFEGSVGCGKSTIIREIKNLIDNHSSLYYEVISEHSIRILKDDTEMLTSKDLADSMYRHL